MQKVLWLHPFKSKKPLSLWSFFVKSSSLVVGTRKCLNCWCLLHFSLPLCSSITLCRSSQQNNFHNIIVCFFHKKTAGFRFWTLMYLMIMILDPRATHLIFIHTQQNYLTQFMEFKVQKRVYPMVLYIDRCITKVLVWKLFALLSVKPSTVYMQKGKGTDLYCRQLSKHLHRIFN